MRAFVISVLLCLLALSPLASQSMPTESESLASLPLFDPAFTYQVPGTLLNEWRAASVIQQQAFEKALKQVSESQMSFGEYKRNTQRARLETGIVSAAIGVFVGAAVVALAGGALR